jgi:hypothetical protein
MEMRRLAGQEQLMDSVCAKRESPTRVLRAFLYVPFFSSFWLKSRGNMYPLSDVFLLKSRGIYIYIYNTGNI